MKQLFTAIAILMMFFAQAQVNDTQQQQAQQAATLLKQLNEPEALRIYQQIVAQHPTDMQALVKCVELNCSIGERTADNTAKTTYFNKAKQYADQAMTADSTSADALYTQALAYAKLAQVESENKKTVEDVKLMKQYADRALSIQPNHAMANYIAGKWHYEMLALNWIKKAALKTFFGKGLATPDIDLAIAHLEKTKTLLPYFVQNYLDLAKAYGIKNRPAQQLEVLNKLVKLPIRTADDAAWKEEGKKMLKDLQ